MKMAELVDEESGRDEESDRDVTLTALAMFSAEVLIAKRGDVAEFAERVAAVKTKADSIIGKDPTLAELCVVFGGSDEGDARELLVKFIALVEAAPRDVALSAAAGLGAAVLLVHDASPDRFDERVRSTMVGLAVGLAEVGATWRARSRGTS